MNSENNKLFELYTLATLSYEKQFKNVVENIEELYPNGWYERSDYKLKIEIIAEAIKENKLIIETSKYNEYIKNQKSLSLKDIYKNGLR